MTIKIKPFQEGDVVEYLDSTGHWQLAKIGAVYLHATRYGGEKRTKLQLDRLSRGSSRPSLGLRGVNVYAERVRHVS